MTDKEDLLRKQNIQKLKDLERDYPLLSEKAGSLLDRTYANSKAATQKMTAFLKEDTRQLPLLIAILEKDPHKFGSARGNRWDGDGWSEGADARREDAAIAAKELPSAVDAMLRARLEMRRLEKLLEPKSLGFFSRFLKGPDRDRPR